MRIRREALKFQISERTPNPTAKDPGLTDKARGLRAVRCESFDTDSQRAACNPGPCPLREPAESVGARAQYQIPERSIEPLSPGSSPGSCQSSKSAWFVSCVVRFTMLEWTESLGICLIYGFMSTHKFRSHSQAQIETSRPP